MRQKQKLSSARVCLPIILLEKFKNQIEDSDALKVGTCKKAKRVEWKIKPAVPAHRWKRSIPKSFSKLRSHQQPSIHQTLKLIPSNSGELLIKIEPRTPRSLRTDNINSTETNLSISSMGKPNAMLSPNTGRTCSLLSSLTRRRVSESAYPIEVPVEVVDLTHEDKDLSTRKTDINNLLKIDLTSPLGIKLAPLVAQQLSMSKRQSVKDYDKYCNTTSTESDSRSLRSQTACEDPWNLNNIHYVRRHCHIHTDRSYAFSKKDRRDRHRTLKCGLNKRSRKLLRMIKPCSITVTRLSNGVIHRISSSLTMIKTAPGMLHQPEEPVSSTSELCSNELINFSSASSNLDISLPSVTSNSSCASEISEPANKMPLRTNITMEKASAPLVPQKSQIGTSLSTLIVRIEEDALAARKVRDVMQCPIAWEDLISDVPKVELQMIKEPELVDLTCDINNDVVIIPLPSPTELLGSWHIPQPYKSTKKHSWRHDHCQSKGIRTRVCSVNVERQLLLKSNTDIYRC